MGLGVPPPEPREALSRREGAFYRPRQRAAVVRESPKPGSVAVPDRLQ